MGDEAQSAPRGGVERQDAVGDHEPQSAHLVGGREIVVHEVRYGSAFEVVTGMAGVGWAALSLVPCARVPVAVVYSLAQPGRARVPEMR